MERQLKIYEIAWKVLWLGSMVSGVLYLPSA
jgi:hypothetical protein